MIMSDVAAIVATVLAALLAMPSIALVYGVFFPGFARRAEMRVTRNPIATFFVGLVSGAIILAFAAALGQGNAAMKLMSAIVAMGGGWAALSGMSGIAARIGHATASPVDRERPWRAIVRGSVIMELACLFPLVGWLLIYPIAIVTGLGAAALALIPAGAPQVAAPAAPQPDLAARIAAVAAPVAPQPAFAAAGPEEVMHR